jgi:hypothetical protein
MGVKCKYIYIYIQGNKLKFNIFIQNIYSITFISLLSITTFGEEPKIISTLWHPSAIFSRRNRFPLADWGNPSLRDGVKKMTFLAVS